MRNTLVSLLVSSPCIFYMPRLFLGFYFYQKKQNACTELVGAGKQLCIVLLDEPYSVSEGIVVVSV